MSSSSQVAVLLSSSTDHTPSTDLKELLAARACLNPHLHSAHIKSLKKLPGREILQAQSITNPTIRPRTPASSGKNRPTSVLETPTSFALTEDSQYSPSFVNSDPDTETLHRFESDSHSVGSVDLDTSYSPIIIEARRTIAPVDMPKPLSKSESPTFREPNDDEHQTGLVSSAQSQLLEISLADGCGPKTPVDQTSVLISEKSRIKPFLGTKLIRHSASWNESSADEYSSDSSNAETAHIQQSESHHSISKNITQPFAQVLTGVSPRHSRRGPSSEVVVFDIVDSPLRHSSDIPACTVNLEARKDAHCSSEHLAAALSLPRSTSAGSVDTTRPSTPGTTPSSSWSSLSSSTDPSLACPVVDSVQHFASRPSDVNKTIPFRSSPSPLQSSIPSSWAPSAAAYRSQSTEPKSSYSPGHHVAAHSLPSMNAVHHVEPLPRALTPSGLSAKLLKGKKSAGFLRTLKKAVGSSTHEEIRVSAPIGNVVRNGGADLMPSARPLPAPPVSAPPTTTRHRNKVPKLGKNHPSSANGHLIAPISSNLHERRGVDGLRPTLNLRPISMAFSAGFAAEFLHDPRSPGESSPSLPQCHSPSDSDMSSNPSSVPKSSGALNCTSFVTPSLVVSSTTSRHATIEELSELERQAKSLRDEIATLKAERETYLRETHVTENGCDKCGCAGGCAVLKTSVLDRPRVKGSIGSPLLFSGARDYV